MYSPLHVLNNRLHFIFHNNLDMISLTFIKNEQLERFCEFMFTDKKINAEFRGETWENFCCKLKKNLYSKYYKPDMEKLNALGSE